MKRNSKPLPYEVLPSADTTVWRYLSLAKLLALLRSRSLFLARMDRLEDPFEGSFSEGSLAEFTEQCGTPYPDGLLLLSRWIPSASYVSCWCASPEESAALWCIYGAAEGSLALQTTIGALQRAFPSVADRTGDYIINQDVRCVQYIDYRTQHPYVNDLMGPLCYKRRAFAFEQEIRVIRQEIPSSPAKNRPGGRVIRIGPAPERIGIEVPIIIPDLIAAVYVAPRSPDWVRLGVRELMDRFGLDAVPCRQSRLDDLPDFGRLR